MATISENLQTIKDNIIAIKQAIIKKGGEVGDLTTYANAITNLSSEGSDVNPIAKKNDVTFYDYDGTILHSFSKDEFLALNELPSLPTQQGLTCQGWNYDITKAKAYVEEYSKLDIGATYITDDGNTRLYIKITAERRMTVPLIFSQTKANGVTINWGDGSTTQTLSGTGNKSTSHTYASIGDYCITLTVASDCTLGLGNNSSSYCVMGSTSNNGRVYCNMLQKVEIGARVTSIGNYALQYCHSLSLIVIPNSVTSIGNYVFQQCYFLSSVIIPNSVTSLGSYVFNSCSVLTSIVIPNSITSIGSTMFSGCYVLSSAVIPSSARSIGASAFSNCYTMISAVIPNTVTQIDANAFNNCYSMTFCDFSTHTVIPTLANTNAFTNIPSDCKIIVPDALYDTWIAATNWSTYASYIIKKSDWDAL